MTGKPYGAISMFVSPVLKYQRLLLHTGHSLSRSLTPMGHEHSTQLHIFVVSHHIFWTNVIWTILRYFAWPLLETSRGFTIRFFSSKTSATFTNIEFPPSVTIVFVNNEFSGRLAISGKTSNRSEVCAVIQRVRTEAEVTYLQPLRDHVQKNCVCGISRLLYDVLMFGALDFRFAQNHALSLWRSCLHRWHLMVTDLSRIGRSCSTVVAEQ